MTGPETDPTPAPTVAVIVSQDDAHAFLLECLVLDEVDSVVHLQAPDEVIDLTFSGVTPAVVLVDVALYDLPGDLEASTAALRIIATSSIVLEVGERLDHSGQELRSRLRGNSLEARDWVTLR